MFFQMVILPGKPYMKKFFSLIIVLFFSYAINAQPPNVPAEKGATFGKEVKANNAMTVGQLLKQVREKDGPIAVKVSGKVSDVCKMEGCWLKLESPDGNIMVKMKDHAFLVPTAINGKQVVIEGTAEQKITSVEMLKHYAEDAGKTQEEIAKITEPKKEVIINADGVLVL